MKLTPQQHRALTVMCDALVPSISRESDPDGYWNRTASDLDVADKVVGVIAGQPEENQKSFLQLLDLFNSSLLGLTWLGPLKPAHKLSPEQREKLLQVWALSPLPLLRNGFNTLKRLVCFIYFGTTDSSGSNPNWEHIAYPDPPLGEALDAPLFETLLIRDGKELSCDTLIVGSGAGGGVVAGVRAATGESVIVVEKGPYVKESEMNQAGSRNGRANL